MIQEVGPGLPEGFCISPAATVVQFHDRLYERDFVRLSAALEFRPDVCLRVYENPYRVYKNLDFLRNFPSIRKLSVELWELSNLDGLQAIRELDEFTFGSTKTKSHSLGFLARFPTLRKLYLQAHKKDIEVIASLGRIERLTLRSITLPGLDLLVALPTLQHLEIKLGGTKNLEALSKLTALRYLELWLIRGLSDLSAVAKVRSLEALFLQSLKNVAALPSLCNLHHLRGVYLEGMNGITDLNPIAAAPALEGLILVDMPNITVGAVRSLVDHPSLRFFSAALGRSLKANSGIEAFIGRPSANWLQLMARIEN